MAWAAGSDIMTSIIDRMLETGMTEIDRSEVYEVLIGVFTDYGCTTLGECLKLDPAFDDAFGFIDEDEDEPEIEDWDEEAE